MSTSVAEAVVPVLTEPEHGLGDALGLFRHRLEGSGFRTMRVFTHQELEALAREQGLPEASLDVAAAIAQAESGGGEARGHPTLDPNAHKDSNGRWSVGLWQINSLNGPPPGEGRGDMTNDQLATASVNALAMAQISAKGTKWKPWGAFNNGSFRKFLTKEADGMEMTTKAQWGAAPAKGKLGVINGSVSKLFLHHTVTESGPPEKQHEIMKSVQQTAFTKGFLDISYSFLVFPTGQITRAGAGASSGRTRSTTTRLPTGSALLGITATSR